MSLKRSHPSGRAWFSSPGRFGAMVVAVGLLAAACGDDGGDTASGGGDGEVVLPEVADPEMLGQVQEFNIVETEGCDAGPNGVAACVHVETTVDYSQTPPVGGNHTPIWQDCLFYDAEIYPEGGVHSMEHGAVWITYSSALPQAQIDEIETMAEDPKVLASPWDEPELPAPVVLSSWGRQLWLESLPDQAATSFIESYKDAPDAPEPGFSCQAGFSGTR